MQPAWISETWAALKNEFKQITMINWCKSLPEPLAEWPARCEHAAAALR
jgi:hypothetical protein